MKNISPLCLLVAIAVSGRAVAQDESAAGNPWPPPNELAKVASWQVVTAERIIQWSTTVLDEAGSDANVRHRVATICGYQNLLNTPLDSIRQILDAIYPSVGPVLEATSRPLSTAENVEAIISHPMIRESQLPKSVSDHLRLLVGRWLAQNDLYDEALQMLNPLTVDDIVEPASLLFYRGLSQHRLLKKEECLETLQQLMENEEAIPNRFAIVGRLMLSDIEPLKTDTLDEISRLMDDIRRRQALFRSGTRVLNQEQEVIDKLNKLIDEMEKQLQQAQLAAGNQINPANPMEDSQIAGGTGPGNVDSRGLAEGGSWGNLPPKQRAAALAEMAKDLPPHYREVIEEYFRQLAKEPRK